MFPVEHLGLCPLAARCDALHQIPQKFLGMYLERRSNLKLLILLADSRREPLASDAGVLEYAENKEDRLYKILLVATKVVEEFCRYCTALVSHLHIFFVCRLLHIIVHRGRRHMQATRHPM